MKETIGMRALSMLLAALLVSGTIVPAVSADCVKNPPGKTGTNDGCTLDQELSLELIQPGSVTMSSVVEVDKKLLHGVAIPSDWKEIPAKQLKPTEEDWAFVRELFRGLPDDDRKQFENTVRSTFEGEASLSEEEEKEILLRLSYLLVEATEGDPIGPKWAGSPGHWHFSGTAGENLGYVSSVHNATLRDYSGWADVHREEPIGIVPPLTLNRHSWVYIWDVPLPGDNLGPYSCEYYMDTAKSDFANYDSDSAYISLGKGLHYIEDLGCPFHTSSVVGQAHHLDYEEWVGSNWGDLFEDATDVDTYYIITDPSEDAKEFAAWSHQYLEPICTIMNYDPDWRTNTNLINYTRILVSETEKMTMGMVIYSTKTESPDTAGSSSVPITDYQTSYAHINDVACSDSMLFTILIDHTYIADLDIWLGWKEEAWDEYAEYQIWDNQGGSADHLALSVRAENFATIHDWQLRVVDTYEGDEGEISEFALYIG